MEEDQNGDLAPRTLAFWGGASSFSRTRRNFGVMKFTEKSCEMPSGVLHQLKGSVFNLAS